MTAKSPTFETEAAMCEAFVPWAKKQGWTAYAETAGWDILLVNKAGWQVGVEAKLSLNPHVLWQAVDGIHGMRSGPDFRAILAPRARTANYIPQLARLLGIAVIYADAPTPRLKRADFTPALPTPQAYLSYWSDETWPEICPDERCKVPEYVPDIVGGHAAPTQLSEWKIKAIKLTVLLERRGYITGDDFKHFQISASRWKQFWLKPAAEKGRWVWRGEPLGFATEHPKNFAQIAADFDKWAPKAAPAPAQARLAI